MKIHVWSKLLTLVVFLTGNAHADDYPSKQSLKKMFTTPHERQQLDTRRAFGAIDDDKSSIVTKIVNHASSVELRGLVYRQGKQPVVWVNESNTLKSRSIDSNIRVYGVDKRQSEDKVRLKVNDRLVKLKPGQVWSDRDDEAKDKYRMNVAD